MNSRNYNHTHQLHLKNTYVFTVICEMASYFYGLILVRFPFHAFLKSKGWEVKVDLTVEQTHSKGKYPLCVSFAD